MAAGEVLLRCPCCRPSVLSRDRACPSSSSPASGVFHSPSVGQQKTKAASTKLQAVQEHAEKADGVFVM
ncbi:unnamed protein product [Rangifer tarandus platyrhynchus]|uniref:Uncharacterized protein n=1 Tax=Rangifer tarandus platyrhynchus TaxID=3082113 RepID=A0ABN8Z895_RANTA|nr:unnamed protein product [Rangifer tarandus platyrhynchus]